MIVPLLAVLWCGVCCWLVADFVLVRNASPAATPDELLRAAQQRDLLAGVNVMVLVVALVAVKFLREAIAPPGQLAGVRGDVAHIASAVDQLTEQMHAQMAELSQQAVRDPLTQLPNRALFMDCLKRSLARGERQGTKLAVLYIDLDDFKTVNDTLGHEAGDQLLVGVAARLQACLRSEDMAARLGGDEFAVLIDEVAHEDDAVLVAQRVLEQLRAALPVVGRQVYAAASVGVAIGGATGGRYPLPETLLRDADAAMYHAKGTGKGRYAVYNASFDAPPFDVPAPAAAANK